MSDIPRRTARRTARLATLPLSYAGRTALGVGRRLGGAPAEAIAAEVAARTADQLFAVLGQLKGGAMKVGQAMSIFEAALPEEVAVHYRGALTALQDAAPSMPAATVHRVLAAELGEDWRDLFRDFDDAPVAAASIGQVHRAVWGDGRDVAVKVQYPGAGDALLSDLRQLSRLARVTGSWRTGIDMRAVTQELQDRMAEELDYLTEASSQRAFARAFAGSEFFAVPDVVTGTGRVLVVEWLDGTPLSTVIREGTPEQRGQAANGYLDFLLAGPDHVGLLHADPHPGNFRLLDDGRLGILDFGAVNRLPDGMPPAVGRLLGLALGGEDTADHVLEGLRSEGWVRQDAHLDARVLLDFLQPFLEPARHDRYRFTRAWLRKCFAHVTDARWQPVIAELDLPPDYLLIHRVWAGGLGVLCQIGGEVETRAILEHWLDDLDLSR
ncbi:ABC1 kinase family protein [Arsenicicoccus sp. oral taxon 190]|uniref:ABC1 kinase family protein n=1 Tax=Arsenicicoccus sp. oral taxon 190 TaxID=1658671 RepID=UPI00067A2BE7|nr:AarF/ABC1/UbiB kinase family protein [Arsenicicoccus sp. oral taxon 190]AKT51402.1 ABC transporter ATP-binding protein [Arsenicicoccus sp. oral taxon 190]